MQSIRDVMLAGSLQLPWKVSCALNLFHCPDCMQMAAALDHMHKRGIVHLDLKPENIYTGSHRTRAGLRWGLFQCIPSVCMCT